MAKTITEAPAGAVVGDEAPEMTVEAPVGLMLHALLR